LATASAHATRAKACAPTAAPTAAGAQTVGERLMAAVERTLEMAVSEVRFGAEFGRLNMRVWQRLDTCLNLLQVLAGALALAGAFSNGRVLAAAGLVMAVVSALQIALQPGRRAADFKMAHMEWQRLAAQVWGMELYALDVRLAELRAAAPDGFDALGIPAMNIVNRRHGSTEVHPMSLRERFMLAVA